MTNQERFELRVIRGEGCWGFVSKPNKMGYYRMYTSDGRREYAHRVSYELFKGPIPNGKEIDHLCCNPSCVNPDHLEAVTHKVNSRRGRQGHARTHCKHGHEYTLENTYWTPKTGHRRCRICIRKSTRANRPA